MDIDLEYYENSISDNFISYYIDNDTCKINQMYFDKDDFKMFVKLLVDFCSKMESENIKLITQLISLTEYENFLEKTPDFFNYFEINKKEYAVEIGCHPNIFAVEIMKLFGINK